MQKFDFLGQVYTNLKMAEIAYKIYQKDGKKYLHAKALKVHNTNIKNLLLNHAHLLGIELFKDSLQVISHLNIWGEKWDELNSHKSYLNDEEFVFENSFTFPAQASQNLEKAFETLRNQQ